MNSLSITTHELPGVAQRVFRKQDIDSQVAQGMQILRGGFWEPRSDLACYDLCVRCSSIPWSGIHIAKIEKTYHMFEMAKTREDLRTSACPSCRLFGSSLPNFDVWSLRISSIDETRLLWERVNPSHPAKRSRNRGYLEFGGKDDKDWMPSSLKVLHKDEAYFVNTASGDNPSFVASKGLIETSKVKAWIRECTSTHTNCRPRPCNGLKRLKVIDCYDASVVLAPESCQFVALSYVWGQPTVKTTPIDKPQFPTLPDILPRTVEDSIKVTKMLGYRYLWVDRYCIDQHNSEDQHRQINQMGAIYSSAQITLIAAAGRDATYGLPGISKTFRYPEVCPVTESLCLVSAPRSVTHSVCASTWLSRAWTLQEGYLSKRRLFFVEHGIEYICDQYLQTGKRLWTPIASELTASLPSKIDHWDRASHMMRQFTGRSLTYEDDALNAIIGALETLESIDHTEGVIIQLSNSSDISSIYMALDWYHNLPCPRRKRFPSWSPLGWQGKIDYLDYKASISSDCSLEVWHDGEMRHVSHAFGKLSEGHRSPRPAEARLLRLSTTVVMLDFEYLDHDSSVPAGLYVKVPYAPELDLFVLPLWDAENVQDMQEDSLQLPCAVATRRRTLTDTTWRCEQESQILIMRQFGTHCERIGCFNLHWGYRTIYARDKQGKIFLLDFAYGNPLVEYGDGTFWKKHGEERTFLLG